MTLFTRAYIGNRFPQFVGRSVPACVMGALAAMSMGLGGVADAQGQGAGDPPPNIVFFLADDMGLGDTSAYQDLTGNPDGYQIDTPHLERLAARGTRFTDAHSNAAVCTPTRLALLSGIHAFRSPIHQRTSFESQDTIGSLMPGDRSTSPPCSATAATGPTASASGTWACRSTSIGTWSTRGPSSWASIRGPARPPTSPAARACWSTARSRPTTAGATSCPSTTPTPSRGTPRTCRATGAARPSPSRSSRPTSTPRRRRWPTTSRPAAAIRSSSTTPPIPTTPPTWRAMSWTARPSTATPRTAATWRCPPPPTATGGSSPPARTTATSTWTTTGTPTSAPMPRATCSVTAPGSAGP